MRKFYFFPIFIVFVFALTTNLLQCMKQNNQIIQVNYCHPIQQHFYCNPVQQLYLLPPFVNLQQTQPATLFINNAYTVNTQQFKQPSLPQSQRTQDSLDYDPELENTLKALLEENTPTPNTNQLKALLEDTPASSTQRSTNQTISNSLKDNKEIIITDDDEKDTSKKSNKKNTKYSGKRIVSNFNEFTNYTEETYRKSQEIKRRRTSSQFVKLPTNKTPGKQLKDFEPIDNFDQEYLIIRSDFTKEFTKESKKSLAFLKNKSNIKGADMFIFNCINGTYATDYLSCFLSLYKRRPAITAFCFEPRTYKKNHILGANTVFHYVYANGSLEHITLFTKTVDQLFFKKKTKFGNQTSSALIAHKVLVECYKKIDNEEKRKLIKPLITKCVNFYGANSSSLDN